ncbi:hypothetical protein [Gorillibacterium sp. sgz500922]|uniref:hypothetical protein n=1 Tax=Gorillibacterium sp. sgz500922 TaxID=3446694 RepID=UPI003F6722D8
MTAARYYIGGSSCAGKSTLARRFAERQDLPLYSCDEEFGQRLSRIDPVRHPHLHRVKNWSPGEMFGSLEVDELLELYLGVFREDLELVLADVAERYAGPAVVEGNQLLPELLLPRLMPSDRAAWIVPSESFQRNLYARREWVPAILADAPDPGEAFERWMQRDTRFAEGVARQAEQLGAPVLRVDGTLAWDACARWLERRLLT